MLRVIAPWSLANFMPLNGFHPLYRSITRHGNPDVRVLVPRDPTQTEYDYLLTTGFFDAVRQAPAPTWVEHGSVRNQYEIFCHRHNPIELGYLSHLSGEAELLHTAPVTRGDRPFFLHAESFLPIFFPFFEQGHGELKQTEHAQEVRTFYARLFESPMCLGIASHLPATLKQLSNFFQSPVIDAKLILSPIGLDQAYISQRQDKSEQVRFIFLASANQGAGGFALRGGVVALMLALSLLRTRQTVKFLFRCARPADLWLMEQGISISELKKYEGNEIVWLQSYLSEEVLAAYLNRSHFLLLPSANLHSVSILSAMANGVIPIVSDTVGTDVYIQHGVTGIILKGVLDAIWSSDADLRLTTDDHTKFLKMQGVLARQLETEVRQLLSAPEKINEMAQNGRVAVRSHFNGERFSNWLMAQIIERYQRMRIAWNEPDRLLAGAFWLEPISGEQFLGPVQPLLWFNAGTAQILQLANRFIYVPLASFHEMAEDGNSACWSPLNLALHERSSMHGSREHMRRFSHYAAALTHASQGISSPPPPPSLKQSLPHRVATNLQGFPLAYSVARTVWRTYRRLGGR